MTTTQLLHKIHSSPELCCDIVLNYEHRVVIYDKLTKTEFVKICKKHSIYSQPTILTEYFDSVKIKIAVTPAKFEEGWVSKITTEKEILIMNDYKNRTEAIIGALSRAVDIYEEVNTPEYNVTQ